MIFKKKIENFLEFYYTIIRIRHYRVSLNIQNAASTLQKCESRPLGVNVNNLICIRPDPSRSKLSTVVPLGDARYTKSIYALLCRSIV